MRITADHAVQFIRGTDDTARDCVTRLANTPNIWTLGPVGKIRVIGTWMGLLEGEVVVEVIARFHGEPDAMRGFGAVYNWLSDRLPHRFEHIGDARESFASGLGEHQRNIAMTYVSDAGVALVGWVDAWNDRCRKLEEKSKAAAKPAVCAVEPAGSDTK